MDEGDVEDEREHEEARPLAGAVLEHRGEHADLAVEAEQLEEADDAEEGGYGEEGGHCRVDHHHLLEVDEPSCGGRVSS